MVPSRWPSGVRASIWSHAILATANSGVESSAPGMPHSQSQNISDEITIIGLRVKRRASSMGVMVSPSKMWIPRYIAAGMKACQIDGKVKSPMKKNIATPVTGPRTGM